MVSTRRTVCPACDAGGSVTTAGRRTMRWPDHLPVVLASGSAGKADDACSATRHPAWTPETATPKMKTMAGGWAATSLGREHSWTTAAMTGMLSAARPACRRARNTGPRRWCASRWVAGRPPATGQTCTNRLRRGRPTARVPDRTRRTAHWPLASPSPPGRPAPQARPAARRERQSPGPAERPRRVAPQCSPEA